MFANEPIDDIISVRQDETFNERLVADFLRGKLPGSENPLIVRQFGGGAANLTYQLDFGSHEYVLRRPPLGPVPPGAHDMKREYQVLSVLHQALPQAPQAFLFSDDEAIIGAPFFVMERRHGTVVRTLMPEHYANRPDSAQKMAFALVDTLAAFHAVDYASLGLSTLGKPEGFITRQIEGWYRRWGKAQEKPLAAMDNTYAWLKANQPSSERATLVHNDYKLNNVMLNSNDPGELVAIFDWDMCTLGDPLSDLGSLLGYWYELADPPALLGLSSMPVGDWNFPPRRALIERYAEKSGQSVGHINFYHALSLYRLTVILAQIYIRFVRGQTKDARFAQLAPAIPILAQAAEDAAAGKLSV